MNTTNPNPKPPANALRVNAWHDLSPDEAPAKYEIISDDGQTKTITLAKGNRIILDTLIKQPVYCASPVRISDRVHILKSEYGVPITKEMYANDKQTGRQRFGVYFIGDGVRRIDGEAS